MKSIFIYICISVVLFLFSAVHGEEGTVIELDETAVKNLQLEVATALIQPVQHSIQAAGTVKLNEKKVVEVTPKISGMVISDPRSLGDKVKMGDVLCQLQSAELSEKISSYVAAEEEMRFAASVADQERKLHAKKLSSIEQLRQKELNLKQAVAAHAKALQPLKLLDFNEGTIHAYLVNINGLDYTTLDIKAPEAGEVISKEVRRGAAVEQDHSLFTIADLSELWVDFYVSLRDVESIRTGGDVQVKSSISDRESEAKIIYISPVADDRSRAVLIRAAMDNSQGEWRPGTPVNVRLSSGKGPDMVAVPSSAIVDYDGGKAVFLKKGDATFVPVKVEVANSNGTLTGIISGLSAGQDVVSRNAAQLKGHLEMTAGE
ncbi:MAG: efflux RND transporter periplasmic adaptor subunit [Verrucomicrobiales bacterium]|nr:efflux RND transporter periplasmic adaptor subunit [Verrucomicrobiales bacterium]